MANGLTDYNFNPRYSASLRSLPRGQITAQASLPAGYRTPRNLPELRVQPSGILPSLSNLAMAGRPNLEMPEMPSFDPNAPIQPSSPSEPEGLGQRAKGILGSIGSFLSNPNTLDNLAIGFGGMSLNPNQGLMQQAANRIENRQELDLMQGDANRTVEYFRSVGRDDLAQAVATNPEMAKALLAEYMKSKLIAPRPGQTVGDVQTDIASGQQYVVTYDPNTGEPTRVNVEGAIGLTPTGKFEMEQNQAQIDLSAAKGLEAFNGLQAIDRQMATYNEMLELLADPTTDTGVVRSRLWAFDASTAQLRSLANTLGLEIIAGTTFGALSAGELRLALDTAIDLNQSKENVAEQIRKKQAAQLRVRAVLEEQALTLSSRTIGYDQYIEDYINQTREDQARAAEGNDPLGILQ